MNPQDQQLAPLQNHHRVLRTIQVPGQAVFDPATAKWEVTSSAFSPQSDGTISVDLEEVQLEDGVQLTHGYPRVQNAAGLVAHRVHRLRADGFEVYRDPLPQNKYHGEAKGKPPRKVCRKLADDCEIVVPVGGSDAEQRENERLARAALAAKTSR